MTTKETVAGLFSVEYVLKVGCPMQSINNFHGNYFNYYLQKLELVATTIFKVIIIIARLVISMLHFLMF